MFKIREWERFQFAIDYQNQLVNIFCFVQLTCIDRLVIQHKKILERTIPDGLKLSIARKIENNLFSRVKYLPQSKASKFIAKSQICASDFFSTWPQRNGRNANSLHSRGCFSQDVKNLLISDDRMYFKR